MIGIGEIVKLKESHYLFNFVVGLCIVDDIKFTIVKSKTRYHIKTLNKNSDGLSNMTWVFEDEVISISDIREGKLNSIL
jgi:hypothetical protein